MNQFNQNGLERAGRFSLLCAMRLWRNAERWLRPFFSRPLWITEGSENPILGFIIGETFRFSNAAPVNLRDGHASLERIPAFFCSLRTSRKHPLRFAVSPLSKAVGPSERAALRRSVKSAV